MLKTIATAAATAATLTSGLLALIPPSAYVPAAVVIVWPAPAEAHIDPVPEPVAVTPQKEAEKPAEPVREPDVILGKIHAYASKYGVSAGLMTDIIDCETGGTFDPEIRSLSTYTFSDRARGIELGAQEKSYGLAQIHMPDNPGVSIAQAKDPDFALEFMAKHLSAGDGWRWSCYPH